MKISHQRGFTLIEIMVVVAILAVALTMSFPAIQDAVHREAMIGSVHDVVDACIEARKAAVLTARPVMVHLFQDGRIELSMAQDDSTLATPVSSDSGGTNSGSQAQNRLATEVADFHRKLADGVALELFDINFVDYMQNDEGAFKFYPNGTSDELTLVLYNAATGERRKLSLEVVTGLVEVDRL